LEFKNIILEVKLSNKFKNRHENIVGRFHLQTEDFKLQEASELGVTAFLENGLGSFQAFVIFQI
jgi:hypothetical protein